MPKDMGMQLRVLGIGQIEVGDKIYDYDLMIERGVVRKRRIGPSRQ